MKFLTLELSLIFKKNDLIMLIKQLKKEKKKKVGSAGLEHATFLMTAGHATSEP